MCQASYYLGLHWYVVQMNMSSLLDVLLSVDVS